MTAQMMSTLFVCISPPSKFQHYHHLYIL